MLSARTSLLVTLCGVCGAVAIPIAQPSTRAWVSERVRVNGVRIDVREATVTAEHSVLSARLSALWRVGEPGGAVRATDLRRDNATVIGRQRGERHEVIRLQSMTPGLTRVVVSSLDLSRVAERVPEPPFPLARGVSVLSVIETEGPQRGTTFILQGPREASGAGTAWADRLRSAGWTTLRSYDGHRRVAGDAAGQVHWARRGADQLEAVVLRHDVATRWVVRVSRHAP